MSNNFINDHVHKVPHSEIHKNESLVVIDATFLGGHPAIHPDFVPVRLHVGDLAVIVEILDGKRWHVRWPSVLVYDLAFTPTGPIYGAESRGEVTMADLEVSVLCQAEGCHGSGITSQ